MIILTTTHMRNRQHYPSKLIDATCRVDQNPKGSKDPNNGALGPKYYNINGIWALKPHNLGPWTLKEWFSDFRHRTLPAVFERSPIAPHALCPLMTPLTLYWTTRTKSSGSHPRCVYVYPKTPTPSSRV